MAEPIIRLRVIRGHLSSPSRGLPSPSARPLYALPPSRSKAGMPASTGRTSRISFRHIRQGCGGIVFRVAPGIALPTVRA